jgi:hypothetical protein
MQGEALNGEANQECGVRAGVALMGTYLGQFMGLLSIVSLVRLFPPFLQSVRFLEQRKKPRGERGRSLLGRMASPRNPMGASLRGQDLRGDDLRDAFLAGVDLMDTDLRGVDLTGANLEGAWLAGAQYDANTRWPEGFDPVKAGAVLVR